MHGIVLYDIRFVFYDDVDARDLNLPRDLEAVKT